MLKTIKMVDDATWARFKGLAARKGTTMGALLRVMVSEYEQSSSDFWETILEGEKILSDDEATGMRKAVARLRKEYGFRA